MIKVLVVDDSMFMRKSLMIILEKDPGIKIVGSAKDGLEALDLIPKLEPDVVTLDIEMPRMDGLTTLQHIMQDSPRPVLMVSAISKEGAEVTLKAMEYGAMDYLAKPDSVMSLNSAAVEQELIDKVKAVAKRKGFVARKPMKIPFVPPKAAAPAPKPSAASYASPAPAPVRADIKIIPRPTGKSQIRDLIAIGVSTGGPPAVQKILTALPGDLPAPIIIAQHMPASFTRPFAERLDSMCQIRVKEAEDGERVRDGVAYVAPGGRHMRISIKLANRTLHISDEPKAAFYRPSANELIGSAGEALGRRALGVMLTGMGSDGIEGVKILKANGGKMLAQSEATCVVYGMPKAVIDANLADEILDIDDMAEAIVRGLYE
ncbi:MAG: chemotaxis response regulator protein-glutamate methylesterase [Deltaproteobacteria bacterium]|nr:chemotaxis response regulator protein-glutamate methylesterase [Deltaproteobacteria bacterium]